MLKGMALLKRKPGLTPGEFREQFEKVHAPLEVSLFPTLKRYVRNYITTNFLTDGDAEPDFDCIVEHWFDDIADFQVMMDAMTGDAGQALSHSGKVFVDMDKNVYFFVEEVESELG
ncbi:EthD domain-containing protein [Chloroflexota bacterium]